MTSNETINTTIDDHCHACASCIYRGYCESHSDAEPLIELSEEDLTEPGCEPRDWNPFDTEPPPMDPAADELQHPIRMVAYALLATFGLWLVVTLTFILAQ